jgi:hypothetical protein
LKAIRLTIYTHPNSQIFLASNELSESLLYLYRKEGYDARVVRYDFDKLTEAEESNFGKATDGPGREFVTKYRAVKAGKSGLTATPVHLSDFMRLLLVYKFGGLYMDADAFVMRNMESVRNALAADPASWHICMDHGRHFTRNGVQNIACTCNCMFSFDKSHPFLFDALTRLNIVRLKRSLPRIYSIFSSSFECADHESGGILEKKKGDATEV